MTDEELRSALTQKLTVPLWPHTGMALGLSRNTTYEAANRGDIKTIGVGKLKRVATSWIRKTVGMEAA